MGIRRRTGVGGFIVINPAAQGIAGVLGIEAVGTNLGGGQVDLGFLALARAVVQINTDNQPRAQRVGKILAKLGHQAIRNNLGLLDTRVTGEIEGAVQIHRVVADIRRHGQFLTVTQIAGDRGRQPQRFYVTKPRRAQVDGRIIDIKIVGQGAVGPRLHVDLRVTQNGFNRSLTVRFAVPAQIQALPVIPGLDAPAVGMRQIDVGTQSILVSAAGIEAAQKTLESMLTKLEGSITPGFIGRGAGQHVDNAADRIGTVQRRSDAADHLHAAGAGQIHLIKPVVIEIAGCPRRYPVLQEQIHRRSRKTLADRRVVSLAVRHTNGNTRHLAQNFRGMCGARHLNRFARDNADGNRGFRNFFGFPGTRHRHCRQIGKVGVLCIDLCAEQAGDGDRHRFFYWFYCFHFSPE